MKLGNNHRTTRAENLVENAKKKGTPGSVAAAEKALAAANAGAKNAEALLTKAIDRLYQDIN